MATLRFLLTLTVAVVFAWSGIAKVARPGRWTEDVRRYRFPQPAKRAVVLIVPWLELGIAYLLVTGHALAGGLLALVVLIVFSLAIVRLRRILDTKAVPCGCMGGEATRDYRLLLLRNGVLAVASLTIAISAPSDAGWSPAATLFGAALLLAAAALWAFWYAVRVHASRADDAPLSQGVGR